MIYEEKNQRTMSVSPATAKAAKIEMMELFSVNNFCYMSS
jgi:hypothetical protein